MSMVLFLQGLNSQYPSVSFSHGGSIGPGVSKRPRPLNSSEVDRYETMKFDPKDEASYQMYRQSIEECVDFRNDDKTGKMLKCTLKKAIDKPINSSNWFNLRECNEVPHVNPGCEPCSQCDDFGYRTGLPCFVIGANRVFNWRPKPYKKSDLPPEMPDWLKKTYDTNCVHVTCDGDFQEVKLRGDNIKNIEEIRYVPNNCIPMRVFTDFFNQTCHAKSVRVTFKLPVKTPVAVRCRLWAENIPYEYKHRLGTTTFSIEMENPGVAEKDLA